MAFEDGSGLWVDETISQEYVLAADAERHATHIDTYNLAVIEGLLQSDRYSRALSNGPGLDTPQEAIDTRVAHRAQRQSVLYGENPPQLRSVINEFALNQAVIIDGETQLGRLRGLSELPNVDIRVLRADSIPFLAAPNIALSGTFRIIKSRAGEFVQTQSPLGAHISVDSEDIGIWKQNFEQLRAIAVPIGRM